MMQLITPGLADEAQLEAVHILHHNGKDDGWNAAAIRDVMAMPGAACYAFTEDGEMLACLIIQSVLDHADVLSIVTAPSHRGRGLARGLMQMAEATLYSIGVREMFLEVRPSNRAARGLYDALGYRTIAIRPRYYADGEDAFLMQKTLQPAV